MKHSDYLKKKKNRETRKRIISVISAIIVFVTAYTVPRHFEVAAYYKKTANYFLYFTDDTYKSVLFTTACSFLFYQSNRLDKGGVPGVREAQGRNRLCSRLD